MKADTRFELNEAIEEQMDANRRRKKNRGKFVSKLRRWMTKNQGSRSARVKILESYPCIVVKGAVVK